MLADVSERSNDRDSSSPGFEIAEDKVSDCLHRFRHSVLLSLALQEDTEGGEENGDDLISSSATPSPISFDWSAYIAEVGGIPAPPDAFPQQPETPPDNSLEEDMLLEALDDRSKLLPAPIGSSLSMTSPL